MTNRELLRTLAEQAAAGEILVESIWDGEELCISISRDHRIYEVEGLEPFRQFALAPPARTEQTADDHFAALTAGVPGDVLDKPAA